MTRAGVVAENSPNVACDESARLGEMKLTQLNALNASARNWSSEVSSLGIGKWNDLVAARSMLLNPGRRSAARVPVAPGQESAKELLVLVLANRLGTPF